MEQWRAEWEMKLEAKERARGETIKPRPAHGSEVDPLRRMR